MAKRGPYKSYLEQDEADNVPRTTKYSRMRHVQAVHVNQNSFINSQISQISLDNDEEEIENFSTSFDECLVSNSEDDQPELVASRKTNFEINEEDALPSYEWEDEERQDKEEHFADDSEVSFFEEIIAESEQATSNESSGFGAVEKTILILTILYYMTVPLYQLEPVCS